MRITPCVLILVLALAATPRVAAAAGPPPLTASEAAPGVWLFRTEPYGDVGLDGNSVAIVTDDGVLLLDANGTPAAARAVLAKLRTITKQPVRWLVLSHWHWDHWYGAEVYRDAFPGLQIVAHERTRALMDGPVQAFNRDGLETQLPGHVNAVETRRDTATGERRARLAAHAERDRFFLEQKRGVRRTLPNVTFTDSLTIFAGGREIRVLHVDRAITPGDAFVWLPREGVLATGDLLIDPITFALFCYPDGWIRTLQYLAALDARVIVPGHGAPMHDGRRLAATLELLQLERGIARDARTSGVARDGVAAKALADPRVLALRDQLTGGGHALDEDFATYLVEWFVTRAWDEAGGPLDDAIPSRP
ncbi:MAG: MBL fold metallo-hydrolase [Candidatus Eisenbacteria bacterium]